MASRNYHVIQTANGKWALNEDRLGFPTRTLEFFGTEQEAAGALFAAWFVRRSA